MSQIILASLLGAILGIVEPPPPQCDHIPTVPYQIAEVDNPDMYCRAHLNNRKQPQFPFTYSKACSVPNAYTSTKNPKVQVKMNILFMPRNDGSEEWQLKLRHEMGHINCPDWRH